MPGFVICQFGCMCERSYSLIFYFNSEFFIGNTGTMSLSDLPSRK